MSTRYLLDTNIISEPVRPRPDDRVLERLQRHEGEICITSTVWHELLFGCYRLPQSVRRIAIEQYLFQAVAPTIPILAYDEQAAAWHAAERARLVGLGRTPSFADGQIAAVAHARQLILVTSTTVDYANFIDVTIEDWRS